jgi:hypothetical protein
VQHPDPRWPGRTAEEAAVLESIAHSAGRKWAEANVELILAQAQAAADAAWSPGLKKAVRRILVALAVVIAAAVIILWFVTDDPSAELIRENFDRIRLGMSLEEITRLLGPPGDYRTVTNTQNDSSNFERRDRVRAFSWAHDWSGNWSKIRISHNPTQVVWRSDNADVSIGINDSGQAQEGVYVPMRIPNDTNWDKFVRKVKRQWQRWFS